MRFDLRGARWVPAFIAGIAISGGVAVAVSADGNTISGCVGPAGHLRVITSGNCLAGETALSWNKQGPTGAAGPQGAPGPAGVPGPPGPAGQGPGLQEFRSPDQVDTAGDNTESVQLIPGSDFTTDVPAGAMIAYGGVAHSSLTMNDCDAALGATVVVDTDRDNQPVSTIAEEFIITRWPSPQPTSGLAALRKRAAGLPGVRLQARDSTAAADGTTTADDDVPSETEDYFDSGAGRLGYYHPTPSGSRHYALGQLAWGLRQDGTSCTPTWTSERRRAWVSIFPQPVPAP